MGEVIVATSGKGGVGNTTTGLPTSEQVRHRLDKKVILIDHRHWP